MRYHAPAKLNLNLVVSPRSSSGMHPLRSVVQTIDLVDVLDIDIADEDDLVVTGDPDVPDGPENLIVKALDCYRNSFEIPPLMIELEKSIPVAAGMGGGSSDAAATLAAASEIAGQPFDQARQMAPLVGSDVSFLLIGGTAEMSGYGERIEPMPLLQGFAVAVVVPELFLSTPDVYQRWDELGGPPGFEVPDRLLPPPLRNSFPIRNDLYRAAVDVEPSLGDFVADVALRWDAPVVMTGSGAACFGFFGDVDEAVDAALSITATRAAFGVELRRNGVARVD